MRRRRPDCRYPPRLPFLSIASPSREEQRMKFWLPLLLLGLIATGTAQAARVYEVRYPSEADLKVYKVQYRSEADLLIYWVDYRSEAEGDALWWKTDYPSEAQLKIIYVDYPSLADLKVYEVEYRSEAGWNGAPRGLIMRP